jgi:hypothetical protein
MFDYHVLDLLELGVSCALSPCAVETSRRWVSAAFGLELVRVCKLVLVQRPAGGKHVSTTKRAHALLSPVLLNRSTLTAHASAPSVAQVSSYEGLKKFGGVGARAARGSKPCMVFAGELFETDEVRAHSHVAAVRMAIVLACATIS